MRKLKKENTVQHPHEEKKENESAFSENIKKEIRLILIISWIFPFFGLLLLHFARKTLHKESKEILCKILNLDFTVVLILFMLVSFLNTLALTKANGSILLILIFLILGVLVYVFLSHIIGTLKWLKGEDYKFRYSVEFFKPYKNIE